MLAVVTKFGFRTTLKFTGVLVCWTLIRLLNSPKQMKKSLMVGYVLKRDTATCGCDHTFCKTCWKSYVCTAIGDDRGYLNLRCPEPSCDAAVGSDMINVLSMENEKKRFLLEMYGGRSSSSGL
ncbi:hypothetical protein L1987_01006 [Smallanthus sonchifolius]|uniref:Uncharacterized protein n=1 Tax=Smallanthus sonchifolius TaxID=185202 RepID=A0ACB9K3Z6_9ASTR|nr:hypothetical protein L1987_01006 [Smallanthus sonchifolius]